MNCLFEDTIFYSEGKSIPAATVKGFFSMDRSTSKRIRQKSAFYLYDHWRRVPGKFLELPVASSDRKESAGFIVPAFSVPTQR